jgi:hypothetical protein
MEHFKGGTRMLNHKKTIIVGLCVAILLGTLTSKALAQTEWEKYAGNPILDIGASGDWDGVSVFGSSVLFDGDDPDPAHRYKMWYSGSNSSRHYRIGYATSPDGIAWERHPANPVLDTGPRSWDGARVSCPTVILDTTDPDPARRYKMWYHGYNGSRWRIGYATSADGIVWHKHSANPVITGSGGAWESSHTFSPAVILDSTDPDPNHRYKMWYSGDSGSNGNNRIGYATSPDGIVWTKHPANPVLDLGPSGAWDDNYAHVPAVLFDGKEYEMWYCGTADNDPSTRIGYAISSSTNGTSAEISVETMHTVSKDDSFPAAINVEGISDLAEFQFDVAFDPTVLRAVTVEEGTFLSDNGGTYWLEPHIDNKAGIITGTACAMTTKGGVDGSGTLATITFKAVSIGESHIELQNIVLSDSSGEIIPAAPTDASVTVVDYPSWDVNKDGIVNVIDMVLVGQYLGGSIIAPQYPNPDVNGDSIVDTRDIVLVGKHFGEVYSSSAPSQDLWSIDPQYLPILAEIYAIMEAEPSADPNFIATKSLIFRLMASAGIIRTEVFQNYPNPFNPETWIPYQLAEDSEVTVRIYNSAGRLIRTLDLGHRAVGSYITRDAAAYWDGKTDTGEYVSSGVFFYTIQAGEFTATKKMAVEK